MQSVSHKNIFAAIRWQMVASLADNQRRQKAWPGDALFDGLHGNQCRGDSALATRADVFFQMMVVNFQLPGNKFQDTTELLADACLFALTHTADFLVR